MRTGDLERPGIAAVRQRIMGVSKFGGLITARGSQLTKFDTVGVSCAFAERY